MLACLLCNIQLCSPAQVAGGMEIVAILARGQFATLFTTRPPSYFLCRFRIHSLPCACSCVRARFLRAAREGANATEVIAKRGFATSAGLAAALASPRPLACLPHDCVIPCFPFAPIQPPLPACTFMRCLVRSCRTCCLPVSRKPAACCNYCVWAPADWIHE